MDLCLYLRFKWITQFESTNQRIFLLNCISRGLDEWWIVESLSAPLYDFEPDTATTIYRHFYARKSDYAYELCTDGEFVGLFFCFFDWKFRLFVWFFILNSLKSIISLTFLFGIRCVIHRFHITRESAENVVVFVVVITSQIGNRCRLYDNKNDGDAEGSRIHFTNFVDDESHFTFHFKRISNANQTK